MWNIGVDYLAEQLEITDPACVKSYGERDKTRFEHMWELRDEGGWRGFSAVEDELSEWIEAGAWTTGDGPKALFDAAVAFGVLLAVTGAQDDLAERAAADGALVEPAGGLRPLRDPSTPDEDENDRPGARVYGPTGRTLWCTVDR